VNQNGPAPDHSILVPFVNPSPVLIVISGPSGVGKDSVIRRIKQLDHPFHFVITATDRKRREREINGKDYYFVTTTKFERMIEDGELIEHALVYDQYKGVPRKHVREALASGKDVVMRLDVQGAASIRKLIPQAITIFIAPPSIEALELRLRRRAGDTDAQMRERLNKAMGEIARLPEFDYVIINHENRLDQAAQQILDIISAAKCRVGRQPVEV